MWPFMPLRKGGIALAGCSSGTLTLTNSPTSDWHGGLDLCPAGPQPTCTGYKRVRAAGGVIADQAQSSSFPSA